MLITTITVINLFKITQFLFLEMFYCSVVFFHQQFGMFETVTSGVIDFFPKQLTNKRVLVNIVTGLAFFICGLPLTMNVSWLLFGFFCKTNIFCH